LGVYKDHSGSVNFVAFQRNGQRLTSTDNTGTLLIWNLASMEPCAVVSVAPLIPQMGPHLRDACAARMTPSGKRIIAANYWGEVRILSADTFIEERILQQGCVELEFSPGGEFLATAGFGTIGLCDSVSGNVLRKLEGHEGWAVSLAFSPDGSQLVSSGYDE